MDTERDRARFDAIVVGTGAGGATVARELSRRGKRLLILERGRDVVLKKESVLGLISLADVVAVGDGLITMRAIATGGTTTLYFGAAAFPALPCFQSLGIDLSAALEEAKRELPITALPDELLGAQTIRIRDSATQLGHQWQKSMMLVELSKCAGGYAGGAKWTARTYLQEALAAGATLLSQARVNRVLIEAGRAIGVEYEQRTGKKTSEIRRAYGTKIILCAGAMASPVILRDSGLRDVASRGFFCQPNFTVYGTVSGLKGRDCFVGSMFGDLDDGISLGDANMSRTLYRMFMLGSRRFTRLFSHSSSIAVGVVVNDRPGGELRPDGRYHKELTETEFKRLAKGELAATKILQNAGARNIGRSGLSAGHVGGVLQIREHLDTALQTEYRDLHVCDGSVIPEGFRLPPTLTLICLGKYLAGQLSSGL